MRTLTLVLVVLAAVGPVASVQAAVEREAVFSMAQGFDDTLIVVSGRVDLQAPDITTSAGFFRTSEVVVSGISKACWSVDLTTKLDCANGPITLEVPAGSSFGFKSATPYSAAVSSPHALTTFVDLSEADGFGGRLKVGESAILSMVDGTVDLGPVPAFPVGVTGGFTTLEEGSLVHVRGPAGILLHTMDFDEEPMLIEGKPAFDGPFTAAVAVVPFGLGAEASFVPARESLAKDGLSDTRLDLLNEVLGGVRFLDRTATAAPLAIVQKADVLLSEVFNGAFIRSRLSDDPQRMGDVGFAKFTSLAIRNDGGSNLSFDGSYTLVAGDLGPGFDKKGIASDGVVPLHWWVIILFVVAAIAVGAWLWVRGGPLLPTKPGPQHWVARVASAIGVVALFFVWDWQLNRVLGSSVLTTEASGGSLGILFAVELATLLLAALLIGLPVFLAVRYGLGLARKPQYLSLSVTAAVFLTLGLGILVLPALVALLVALVA